jgi:Histidine kinase
MTPPNSQFTDAAALPSSLTQYAVALCLTGLSSILLVGMLTARTPQIFLYVVAPVAVLSLVVACAVGVGIWPLIKAHKHASVLLVSGTVIGAIAGASLGLTASIALRAGLLDDNAVSARSFNRIMIGAPLFGVMIGFAFLLLQRLRAQEKDIQIQADALRTERMQRDHAMMVADLKVLQAQIEPHFLYNTLANLRQLVRTDATRATALLDQLVRYFRLTIPNLRAARVSLADELALCETFVDIMRLRIDQPIELTIDVPESLRTCPIAPGMLLTLIENVIKHGLPEIGAAQVSVKVTRTNAHVIVKVVDNGTGATTNNADGAPAGVGLTNIRERLALLYGDKASLQMESILKSGCQVALHLPYEPHAI